MQDITCAVCGKNQQKTLLYKATLSGKKISGKTFSARRTPDKIHYQLNKCTSCGLIFSSPIFSNKKISKLYSKSFLSYPNQVAYATKTYIHLFASIQKELPRTPSVLEIGCGDGFFMKELRKKGVKQVFGVEPSKKMIASMPQNLRKNVKQSIFKKGLFPSNMFDVVCCFHTLDHVVHPNELLTETYAILKKKGFALFVLHDTSALSVKLFGEKSPIFDIEHIYLFNKKNIATFFKKNGFNKVTVSDLKNTYPLSYWIQMAGIPGIFKTTILTFLKAIKFERIPLTFKGGNMYVIAQKD